MEDGNLFNSKNYFSYSTTHHGWKEGPLDYYHLHIVVIVYKRIFQQKVDIFKVYSIKYHFISNYVADYIKWHWHYTLPIA